MLNTFSEKPRTLLLIDGLGAASTTGSLYFVLSHYHDYFGMPVNILMYLSVIGLVFCAYSVSCYLLLKNYWTPYLRIIGIGNGLYCVLTMMLLYQNYTTLTPLGLIYFLAEMLIILSLVYIELKVANRLSTRKME